MKLFFLVSSLDLTQPFSATPAWWQLMKGLYEIGVEVIAAPYQGPAIESLWWRASHNPAKLQGDLFKFGRDSLRRIPRPQPIGVVREPPPIDNANVSAPFPEEEGSAVKATDEQEPLLDRLIRSIAQTTIAPLWLRHIDRVLTREPDIDAVIFLTPPLNHLVGVAGEIQDKHSKPVLYYDGDVPASLPNMGGFASGFRIYQGADMSEYAAFISNSAGGAETLKSMGANAVHTLYYGADPDVFCPVDVPSQDIDVFFYGHGREYRTEWVEAMLTRASNAVPDAHFAVRGTKLGNLGRAEMLPYLSFSKLREYASRSKLNLCITRAAHASIYASSSSRPFELASMGCCIVANPYLGIEEWFEPDKEIFIVNSNDEAVDRYRYLLSHDTERRAAGNAARFRVLKEHTFRHRAQQLVEIVKNYV
jgi:glycosyltransferase involved in cell wall biosynthesis